jgi:hypothetical protein
MKFGHEIKPNQIVIKDINVLRGLMERRFSPLLITIVLEIAKEFGIFFTESYRKKRHRNDLHGTIPVRAIDIRSWIYPDKFAYDIMSWINRRWIYDPDRPKMVVAMIHNSGKGIHFHIQICSKTIIRSYSG